MLIILPRFKRDYRTPRKHAEFDAETLEYVFDVMISGGKLPDSLREHRLHKRNVNWTGFTECHLGADLLLVYRVRRESVTPRRIGRESQPQRRAAALRDQHAMLDQAGDNTAGLITPMPHLTSRFGPQVLWRANINDAVYISRNYAPHEDSERRLALHRHESNLTAQWALAPSISLFGEYLREIGGNAI